MGNKSFRVRGSFKNKKSNDNTAMVPGGTNPNGSSRRKSKKSKNTNANTLVDQQPSLPNLTSPKKGRRASAKATTSNRESALSDLKDTYEVDWSPTGVLGKGHYAVVFRGYNKLTQQPVAVKRIKRSLARLETLQTEVRALRKVSGHPNIVQLYDVFFDDTYVVLVMELLAGGELFDRIVENGAYSERDASIHTQKIALALQSMHRQNIVHRDLKPENLVLADKSANSEIKISDFGLSKILKADQQTMQTVCGTRAYSAPEVGFGGAPRSGNYNAKVDTWSLGVILYVVLAAYHPFDPFGDSPDHVIWDRICRGNWNFNDPNWQDISAEAKDLITNLLQVDVSERFGTTEILEHPWVVRHNDIPSTPLKSLTSSRSLRNFLSDRLPFVQTPKGPVLPSQPEGVEDAEMSVVDTSGSPVMLGAIDASTSSIPTSTDNNNTDTPKQADAAVAIPDNNASTVMEEVVNSVSEMDVTGDGIGSSEDTITGSGNGGSEDVITGDVDAALPPPPPAPVVLPINKGE